MTDDEVGEALQFIRATLERHGLGWVVRQVEADLDAASLEGGRDVDGRSRLIAIVDAAVAAIDLTASLSEVAPGYLTAETQANVVVIGIPDIDDDRFEAARDWLGVEITAGIADELPQVERLRTRLVQLMEEAGRR